MPVRAPVRRRRALAGWGVVVGRCRSGPALLSRRSGAGLVAAFSAASRASSAAISSGVASAGARGLPRPARAVAGQQVLLVGSGSNESAAPPARAATSSSVAPGTSSYSASGSPRLELRARPAAGRALAGAFDRRVGDERAQQADGADRVVVGRDDVVELVRVDVRVAGADDRDLELVGLGHARSARGAGRR